MLIFHETQWKRCIYPCYDTLAAGRLDLKYKPCLGDTNVFIFREGCSDRSIDSSHSWFV